MNDDDMEEPLNSSGSTSSRQVVVCWVSGKELHMHADFWDDFFYFIWDSPHSQQGTTKDIASTMNNRICRERRHFSPGKTWLFRNLQGLTMAGLWRRKAFVYESQGSLPKTFVCAHLRWGFMCSSVIYHSARMDWIKREETEDVELLNNWKGGWQRGGWRGFYASGLVKSTGINNDVVSRSGLLKLNQCRSVITIWRSGWNFQFPPPQMHNFNCVHWYVEFASISLPKCI